MPYISQWIGGSFPHLIEKFQFIVFNNPCFLNSINVFYYLVYFMWWETSLKISTAIQYCFSWRIVSCIHLQVKNRKKLRTCVGKLHLLVTWTFMEFRKQGLLKTINWNFSIRCGKLPPIHCDIYVYGYFELYNYHKHFCNSKW
jgi:hypothetical protein